MFPVCIFGLENKCFPKMSFEVLNQIASLSLFWAQHVWREASWIPNIPLLHAQVNRPCSIQSSLFIKTHQERVLFIWTDMWNRAKTLKFLHYIQSMSWWFFILPKLCKNVLCSHPNQTDSHWIHLSAHTLWCCETPITWTAYILFIIELRLSVI